MYILSGDNQDAVNRLAALSGIDQSNAHGGLSPADKLLRINELRQKVKLSEK